MGGAAEPGHAVDYRGVRYNMCCGGCDGQFAKNPGKFLESPKVAGKLLGASLFDPVTGLRIAAKNAKAATDYDGTRYYFASKDSVDTFKADPKKYATYPEMEALYCPVMKHSVESYSEAGGYVDHEGVRYFVCCGDCMAALKKTPEKFVMGVKDKVKAPKAVAAKE